MVKAVVGANWGDEGKGKITDTHITNIIGNGVALNIPLLMKELEGIEEQGVPAPHPGLRPCQIVMPYHILFDQYEEERLAGKSFGSTKSGIAPFYSDKYAKIGFQVSELFGRRSAEGKDRQDLCPENM